MDQREIYKNLEEMAHKKDPWKKEAWYYALSTKNLLKLITAVPHASILEVGCAQGDFTKELSKIAKDVTAIDVSESEIKRAKEKNPQVTFAVSSLEDFESQKTFDIIVCSEVLYYIQDRRKALEKLQKLGKYVVTSHFFFDLPALSLKSILYEWALRKFPLRKRIIESSVKDGLLVVKSLRRLQLFFLSLSGSLYLHASELQIEALLI